jgi:hypothetical protein
LEVDAGANAKSPAHNRNHKEDAIIGAIDMKKTLSKHADWVEKLRAGQIDVSQFLSALSPDVAIELVDIALAGESEKNRLAAMQDILDRAGHGKINKHAIASVDPNQPKEQLISLIMGLNKKSKAIEIEEDDDSED